MSSPPYAYVPTYYHPTLPPSLVEGSFQNNTSQTTLDSIPASLLLYITSSASSLSKYLILYELATTIKELEIRFYTPMVDDCDVKN